LERQGSNPTAVLFFSGSASKLRCDCCGCCCCDGGGVGGGTEAVGLTARTCWATVAETAGMVAAGRRPGPFCAEVGLLLLLIKTLGWDGAPTGKFNRVSGWEGGAGAGAGRTGGGSAGGEEG